MDEAWLDAATADLDNHWVPTLGGGGGPAAPTAPATAAAAAACGGGDDGSCESATATVSALGARPRMGAWSEGEHGVQTSGGDSHAAKWQPQHQQPQQQQQPQQPPSPGRSEASHGSSAQGQTREAALRDLAEEWGCTDPKLAEVLMRRKQKMQRAGRKTEQKRKDPMKRLAALQRKVAVLPPHAEAQHSPRQPLVLARHEPGAAENAGMRRLSPRQLRLGDEGGYAAGCEEEMQQEIQDDLDLDLASDELHDEPLRSFASDTPNAKLRRSMRPPPRAPSASLPRAELPTGSRSLNGSRLSSPAVHGVSSLPVGSALQAARASSAGRFSGT